MYDEQKRTITANGLLLRPFRTDDIGKFVALCNSSEQISRNSLHMPYPMTKQDFISWHIDQENQFENGTEYNFAITDKQSGELLGAIELTHDQENNKGEVGYWVGQQFWGRGIATASLIAIIDFAFKYKGYHRVCARHFSQNIISGKVARKAGMTKEGVHVHDILKDGIYKDMVCYGIINHDQGFLIGQYQM